jgi:predicted NUDIX family NTP pyrophosphohydrolase
MAKKSAGILIYRHRKKRLEVFLVHPGGPYWTNKDEGSWSIPKGEYEENEEPLLVARREFNEETGFDIEMVSKRDVFIALHPLIQPSGKQVSAWATEGDCDTKIISNLFSMEWPPNSGKIAEFPEVDRAEWFPIDASYRKIHKGQAGFLDQLCALLS